MPKQIIVHPNREKPILNRHPWIFSGAIDGIRGDPEPGEIVDVVSKNGRFLARGYFNPRSQIQVRILTWNDEPIDEAWWRRMLKRSLQARLNNQRMMRGFISAYRAINAENDYLPGLVIDWYDPYYVLQALTLGIDIRKEMIARLLVEVHDELHPDTAPDLRLKGIYERSDVDARKKEGLKSHKGVLWGEAPPDSVRIHEEFVHYDVDVYNGHKTGFYLDQRVNRRLLLDWVSDDFLPAFRAEDNGHRTLNLFSYTGGFGIAALYGGHGLPGHIVNVDASRDALEIAERNFQLNFIERRPERDRINIDQHVEFIQADVFDLLHDFADEGQKFDVIICDPPKFAHNAGQVERAARGYKDLNLNCFKILNPVGYLMTYSCSGAIDADLFQKIVFGALADSGRDAQIIRHLSAGDDHPVALTFPEGAYLKGLLLRVF